MNDTTKKAIVLGLIGLFLESLDRDDIEDYLSTYWGITDKAAIDNICETMQTVHVTPL